MVWGHPSVDFWLSGRLRFRKGDGPVVGLDPTLLGEVLALLLLRANSPVTVAEIRRSIWPEPTAAGHEVQVRPYIARLRKLLDGAGVVVANRRQSYSLEIDPVRVDFQRFALLRDAADRTGPPEEKLRLLEDALAACPRDGLLVDFTRAWIFEARRSHSSNWDVAALARNTILLREGRHAELLDLLRRENVQQSADPRRVADYLIALYRDGQAEQAVAHFEMLERFFVHQGKSVPTSLTVLAASIRSRDPRLDLSRTRSAYAIPNLLPPPRSRPEGRHGDLSAIRAHANAEVHDTIRVVGIYGPPGIGKTLLATAYAHRHADAYPGGVLYADLGAHGSGDRLDADRVLTLFLGALGVAADQIPVDHAARVDRYRSLSRRQRTLLLLDNVASTEDVVDLLPTAPGSLAMVTSRSRLTALTARFGALAIVLNKLEDRFAIDVLDRFVAGRSDYAPAVVADIARACDGHPLALCLAGARIAVRPEEPLTSVAAALADRGNRIPALDLYAESGDRVVDVFGWSYRSLGPLEARVFRHLGLAPCASLDVPAIVSLTGLDVDAVQAVLIALAESHLIVRPRGERYTMHDLVAEYAAALAADVDPPAERDRALDRLYAYHLDGATAAVRSVWPLEAASVADPTADKHAALRWLEEHREDLLAAVRHPAGTARPAHIVALAAGLFRYLDHGGRLPDAEWLHRAAVDAAERLDDDSELARALGHLGAVLVRLGRTAEAEAAIVRSRELHEHLGDVRGEAVALGNLGRIAARQGRFAEAITYQRTALTMFRACSDRVGAARTLTNLGIACESIGDLPAAARHLSAAEAICVESNLPDALARVHGVTAGVFRAQGRLDEASARYEKALDAFHELGDRVGEATTLTNLGVVRVAQRRPADAVDLHEQALAMSDEIGDKVMSIEILNNLGFALAAGGRVDLAAARHRESLARADEGRDLVEVARAHAGLAMAHARMADRSVSGAPDGQRRLARHHLDVAVGRFVSLGMPCPAELSGLSAILRAG